MAPAHLCAKLGIDFLEVGLLILAGRARVLLRDHAKPAKTLGITREIPGYHRRIVGGNAMDIPRIVNLNELPEPTGGEHGDISDLRYEVMYFLETDDDAIPAFKDVWAGIGDSIGVTTVSCERRATWSTSPS